MGHFGFSVDGCVGTSILHGKGKADRRLAARTDGQKKPRVWARGDGSLI
nr:MAG TPA: hypothetical protein [Caudoviricetes sp.]